MKLRFLDIDDNRRYILITGTCLVCSIVANRLVPAHTVHTSRRFDFLIAEKVDTCGKVPVVVRRCWSGVIGKSGLCTVHRFFFSRSFRGVSQIRGYRCDTDFDDTGPQSIISKSAVAQLSEVWVDITKFPSFLQGLREPHILQHFPTFDMYICSWESIGS